jgi:hypothetical protein
MQNFPSYFLLSTTKQQQQTWYRNCLRDYWLLTCATDHYCTCGHGVNRNVGCDVKLSYELDKGIEV